MRQTLGVALATVRLNSLSMLSARGAQIQQTRESTVVDSAHTQLQRKRGGMVLQVRALVTIFVALAVSADVGAQVRPVARAADGHADLQGVWEFATLTPLQRPAQFADKPFLTEAEARRFGQQVDREQNTDRALPDGPISTRTFSQLAYNDFWWERASSMAVINSRIPSSLIMDPPDGRLPKLTAAAQQRRDTQEHILSTNTADDPEQRLLGEQCLSTHGGPPMLPARETSFVRIVQTKNFVVIAPEVANEARIVALDGRPHLPQTIGTWRGDSRGRWEGDTLAVDTTNIRTNETLAIGVGRAQGETFHLIERFTMSDADTVLYEFIVDAPGTFVSPWTAVVPLRRTAKRMFEYACHEGNYGLVNMLRGARAQDQRRDR
jgi:hypothetical protein